MEFAAMVQPLIERKDLDFEQAQGVMRFLMSGEATDAQIGGILLGLRIKGCTTRELAAFASVLREKAATLHHSFTDLVDTCGTGGGSPSFNISTASAIVASAAGVRIAKHGNRAVTSRCGSADVLEALGVNLTGDAEQLLHRLDTVGIIFMFAPAHHAAMRHVGRARKELGLRTVFNQLGPLANPAGAQRQLIGVYDAGLMRSMGDALRQLGAERVMLVHGCDGLDEISPCAPTEVVKVWDGQIETLMIQPSDFGLEPISPEALAPSDDLQENADILRSAVSDVDSLRSQAIVPNVAAAIYIAGLETDLAKAATRAKDTIRAGLGRAKLEQLIESGDSA